jgi:hypothetical protein
VYWPIGEVSWAWTWCATVGVDGLVAVAAVAVVEPAPTSVNTTATTER